MILRHPPSPYPNPPSSRDNSLPTAQHTPHASPNSASQTSPHARQESHPFCKVCKRKQNLYQFWHMRFWSLSQHVEGGSALMMPSPLDGGAKKLLWRMLPDRFPGTVVRRRVPVDTVVQVQHFDTVFTDAIFGRCGMRPRLQEWNMRVPL